MPLDDLVGPLAGVLARQETGQPGSPDVGVFASLRHVAVPPGWVAVVSLT